PHVSIPRLVLKRLSRPNAPIKPVVTEEPAHAKRRQPSKLEPTGASGSDKTDNRPENKRSSEFQPRSRNSNSIVRRFRTVMFGYQVNARFRHFAPWCWARHGAGKVKILHLVMYGEDQQKRCVRRAEHIAAAKRDGMSEHHPPFAGMYLHGRIAGCERRAGGTHVPPSPGKVSDYRKHCAQVDY